MATDKQRVCILGSGPSALSAAYQLTMPALEGRFEVTIYQMGWRSGGLCAGGRVPPEYWVNQNGTHYLFGCYSEALYLLRACCDELLASGDTRFGPFESQVIARPLIVLMQRFLGEWTKWEVRFDGADPGAAGRRPPEFGAVDIFRIALRRLVQWMQTPEFADDLLGPDPGRITEIEFEFELAAARGAGEALLKLVEQIDTDKNNLVDHVLCWAIIEALKLLRGLLGAMIRPRAVTHVRASRMWMIIDFVLTATIGALSDNAVGPQLVEVLDDIDLKVWLAKYGADQSTVDSPILDLWYDAMAAFVDGDPSKPLCAAGASLLCLGQIVLNYAGAVSFQLHYEVADSVIGPIVGALRNRGVKFVYFHRVWELVPEGDGIARVVLERQAELTSGDPAGYDPFFYPLKNATPPDPRPLWPDSPNLQQIAKVYAPEGSELDRFYCPRSGPDVVLERGRDYDVLVCALSGPTLKWYASALGKVNSDWANLLPNIRGVETQGLRLWLTGTLDDVGWTEGPPVLSSYVIPFATWEDPTPVLDSEIWPQPKPLTCSHLFGPLPFISAWPDPTDTEAGNLYLRAQQARAQSAGVAWMQTCIAPLWPNIVDPDSPKGIMANAAVCPEAIPACDGPGQIRANSGPDQAYLWLCPGTWKYRLHAARSGFKDFYAVGDWTRTNFPCGSIEAATRSGAEAAEAIIKAPL